MVSEVYGLAVTSVSIIVGVVVWCVRLEGRINGHDTLFTEREKQSDDRWEEVIRRLDRIEKKQDAGNGSIRREV